MQEKINVLYLSYDGMTDPLGQSQVLPYLSELSKHGYEFHLISFEKTDRYQKHHKVIEKICRENKINWHPQDYNQGGGLKTTLKQVREMQKVAFDLHRKYNFKIVHCRSYISALIGKKMKRKFGTKFIFDMRGFWANERIDGNIWSLSSPVYRTIYNYFKRKEVQFFQSADYTISLTENGKNEILSWKEFKQNPIDIQVIPCCVDLEKFNPSRVDTVQKNELKKNLQLEDSEYILGYIGSIGTWYMLSEMLDYFKILQEEKPTAKFLFVSGESREKITKEAQKKSIDTEKIIVKSCLHHEMPTYISLFDTSVFFIKPAYSKKASSPTKQGELMAMGVPVVCNFGVGDTDKIVLQNEAGLVISEFSEDSYRKSIVNPQDFDSEKIIEGASRVFSLKEGAKNYLKVYKAVYGN